MKKKRIKKFKEFTKVKNITDVPYQFVPISNRNSPSPGTGLGALISTIKLESVDPIIGKEFWFEYHCFESDKSGDAQLWYRSHQKVIVIGRGEDDHDEFPNEPKVYRIQFEDGFIGDAWDDELMDSPEDFYRPDPPKL